MNEGLGSTPEEEVNRSEGAFVDPEAQAHAEVLTADLPLYEEYFQELGKKAAEIGKKIQEKDTSNSSEEKMKLDLVVLEQERTEMYKNIMLLKGEMEAIEGKDEKVHDFMNDWRRKLNLPLLNDEPVNPVEENPE